MLLINFDAIYNLESLLHNHISIFLNTLYMSITNNFANLLCT